MAWDEEIFSYEGGPGVFKIWEWHLPIDLDTSCILSNIKCEPSQRRMCQVSFAELAVVVQCDLGAILQEMGETNEGVVSGG